MTWKRKTEHEIAEHSKSLLHESRNPKEPATFAVIVTVIFFLVLNYTPFLLEIDEPLEDPWSNLAIAIVCGLVTFVSFYIKQIWQKRSIESEVEFTICNQCNKTDHQGNQECECGGKLEPCDYYTNID